MKQPESYIRRTVKEYLQYKGYFVFPLVHSALSYPGAPDLMALKNGKWLCLEIKRPSGRISSHQKKFRYDVMQKDGEYHIITSLEDIQLIVP